MNNRLLVTAEWACGERNAADPARCDRNKFPKSRCLPEGRDGVCKAANPPSPHHRTTTVNTAPPPTARRSSATAFCRRRSPAPALKSLTQLPVAFCAKQHQSLPVPAPIVAWPHLQPG